LFFFSSRRRHTRFSRDWSSDVCSSDLFLCAVGYLYIAPIALALVSRDAPAAVNAMMVGAYYLGIFIGGIVSGWLGRFYEPVGPRSEERRVGKECGSRGWPAERRAKSGA